MSMKMNTNSGGRCRWTGLAAGVLLATATNHVAFGLTTSSSSSSSQSCVQTAEPSFVSCPCDAASYTFTMEGQTSVEANTVNLAVVLDASGSISSSDFDLANDFAKDANAAFAARNLYDNGGTASYVTYATTIGASATFTSEADFDAFVDSTPRTSGGTNTYAGIAEGRALLNANPSSAGFMIVVTDGAWNSGGDPADEANAARAEGITIFAVGVGGFISQDALLDIGGDASNVFDIGGFDELNQALEDILSSSGGSSVVPCPSTGVVIEVEFSAPVSSSTYPGAVISGNIVTFTADDLEDTLTEFAVVLDTCTAVEGDAVVNSVSYSDDEGNSPDVSELLATGTIIDCGDGGVVPTPSPEVVTTTLDPAATPTPGPSVASMPTATATPAPVDGGAGYDCSVCSNLTDAQREALAGYDNGGKQVVCDPTCVDGVSDPSHCNYFGLGQVCRGCGDCSVCTPCP